MNFTQSFSLSEDVAQKNSQTFAKWGGFVAKNFYGDDALFLLDAFKGVPWFRKGFESASWQSLAGKNMEALYRNAGNQEDGSSQYPVAGDELRPFCRLFHGCSLGSFCSPALQ